MKSKRHLIQVMIITVLLLQMLSGPALALEVNDVAGEFICNCGCFKLLSACEMQCGVELRGYIKEQIDKGLGQQQIIQFMKVNFSEALLAAPEKKGFNLTAWITPFAVVIIGGIVTNRVVSSWVAKRREDDEDDEDKLNKSKADKKYGDKVEEELKDFGE